MIIPIERRGTRPVFRQIVDYLRRNIESGRLPAGTKLRPIRLLASELGVNRETVADAYRELETLGLTQSGVGRGTFVLDRPAARRGDPRGSPENAAPHPRRSSRCCRAPRRRPLALPAIDYDAPRHARCASSGSCPTRRLYPVDEFRKACSHVLRHSGRALLDYGDPRGHEGLRRLLVERLTAVGIEAEPDGVVLTAGSTQALALVTRVFCDPGDAVVVEEPTYAGACATFAALSVRPVAVPVRADGLDLDALDTLLGRGGARLLYTMPSFHNPTGITTTLEHRRRLLEITARHGIPVLEDDFEKDMRVRGRPVPPLKALDRTGQVVYVGTFSKTLFPGVRIGWIVGPPRVANAALVLKRATDLASSVPLQAAVAHFCHTGAYDRHLRRVAKELARRLERAATALEAHLPDGSSFTRPEGGFAIWVTLPADIDTRDAPRGSEARRRGLFTGSDLLHRRPAIVVPAAVDRPGGRRRHRARRPRALRSRGGALAAGQRAGAAGAGGPRMTVKAKCGGSNVQRTNGSARGARRSAIMTEDSYRLKTGLAEMLKGGVILDVTSAEQARIAEDAGAAAVMALERVPADIRREGGVARMAAVERIEEIRAAVSIPVMAKCRIGHFMEARLLEALGVDFIDESEVLTPADEEHHIDKHAFRVPFVCGARDLGEALRRIGEGAAMIRTKGEAGSGNIVEAVRHLRQIGREIRELAAAPPRGADGAGEGTRRALRPRVARSPRRAACRYRTSRPAASRRPPTRRCAWRSARRRYSWARASSSRTIQRARARAIVRATTHWEDPAELLAASRGLGAAMPGLTLESIPAAERLAARGW